MKINLLKKGGITIWELFGNHLAAAVFKMTQGCQIFVTKFAC